MKIKSFINLIDSINEWVGRSVAFLILPITFITTMEVILRYFFKRPTLWAWDINVILMGAITVLAGGYILLKGGHVAVDLIVTKFSPRVQAAIAIVLSPLFFLSIVILLWHSGTTAYDSLLLREKTNSTWGAPLYPLRVIWVIGVFLFLLQGVAQFIRDLMKFYSKEVSGQ